MKDLIIKQLEDMKRTKDSFSVTNFRQHSIISEIKQSKRLIQLLKDRDMQVEYWVGRKWYDDWIEDGIKNAENNILMLSKQLVELL